MYQQDSFQRTSRKDTALMIDHQPMTPASRWARGTIGLRPLNLAQRKALWLGGRSLGEPPFQGIFENKDLLTPTPARVLPMRKAIRSLKNF